MSESTLWYSPVRGYYMSDEEARKNKGEILLEISENAQQIGQWRDKARGIANELYRIANQLSREPEKLVFSGEPTPLEFQHKEACNAGALDLAGIREARDSLRKLELRRRELERSKSAHGIH